MRPGEAELDAEAAVEDARWTERMRDALEGAESDDVVARLVRGEDRDA